MAWSMKERAGFRAKKRLGAVANFGGSCVTYRYDFALFWDLFSVSS
jgi:hypothetical protein